MRHTCTPCDVPVHPRPDTHAVTPEDSLLHVHLHVCSVSSRHFIKGGQTRVLEMQGGVASTTRLCGKIKSKYKGGTLVIQGGEKMAPLICPSLNETLVWVSTLALYTVFYHSGSWWSLGPSLEPVGHHSLANNHHFYKYQCMYALSGSCGSIPDLYGHHSIHSGQNLVTNDTVGFTIDMGFHIQWPYVSIIHNYYSQLLYRYIRKRLVKL